VTGIVSILRLLVVAYVNRQCNKYASDSPIARLECISQDGRLFSSLSPERFFLSRDLKGGSRDHTDEMETRRLLDWSILEAQRRNPAYLDLRASLRSAPYPGKEAQGMQHTRSQCAVCHRTFAETKAFDAHRVGPYTRKQQLRRCLSRKEMRMCSMTQNEQGWWMLPGRATGESNQSGD